MMYIRSSEHIHLMTKFIPLDQHLPIFHILSPWQPPFNYVFMIWLLKNFTYEWNIPYLSLSGLFYLV